MPARDVSAAQAPAWTGAGQPRPWQASTRTAPSSGVWAPGHSILFKITNDTVQDALQLAQRLTDVPARI